MQARQTNREIVILWGHYGPYHFARIKAVIEQCKKYYVRGIEISDRTGIYPWRRGDADRKRVSSLVVGENCEDVRWYKLIYILLRRCESYRQICWFIPSYSPSSSFIALFCCSLLRIPVIMMNDSHAGTSTSVGLRGLVKRVILKLFVGAIVASTNQNKIHVRSN